MDEDEWGAAPGFTYHTRAQKPSGNEKVEGVETKQYIWGQRLPGIFEREPRESGECRICGAVVMLDKEEQHRDFHKEIAQLIMIAARAEMREMVENDKKKDSDD